jgi:immune inhibitor A
MNSPVKISLAIIGLLLLVFCCLIALSLGVGKNFLDGLEYIPTVHPTIQQPVESKSPSSLPATATLTYDNQTDTLESIQQTIVPERDLIALACEFRGICNVPNSLTVPEKTLSAGEERQFWILNTDTSEYTRISASLKYVSPHVYFWVQNGVRFDQTEAIQLIDTFENKIYPTNREFFGSEWTPGVDGDPHLYIIYANNLGKYVAGFFSSDDEYLPQINEYSNAHESFYINTTESLANDYTYGTLAHEFQHMIHWYQDVNEDSFLDEGFSELASFLNGYSTGGVEQYYLAHPDITLTDWEGEAGDNYPHYGANFLFVTYFLDRFGESATKALIHNQENSLPSIDAVLKEMDIRDPVNGESMTADSFFMDWVIANYLQDPTVEDGRYYYHNYPTVPSADDTEVNSNCLAGKNNRTVSQYGVDYIHIQCPREYTLSFSGSTSVRLLPEDPHSGLYSFWSNKGDKSDMTLTREFDFRNSSGPLTLDYWIWYDLENKYDYVYLEASIDGNPWELLITPSGTGENPSGNSYGWGYTGSSEKWINEKIDISRMAGHLVSFRFEYITDNAVFKEGLQVDDISIPEIGYKEDFEMGDGGWITNGFIRIQNNLPQTFRLAILDKSNMEIKVDKITLSKDQTAQVTVKVNQEKKNDIILVVAATTRFTNETATYEFELK